ncbi:hypothetical protein AW40_27210 [Kosakonia radicincitans UMEnt01/12]|uniref:hypothetical protein n=1 Tax=Kosakonia radicincitans TaxID=283686 RepID=UPI0004617C88|nr:hypothetical protein [Kosakonia radicincitans]KDE33559.1 hypothetical protein AW40_27210 [Kosakonia radicincitans UMEnt01/12]
MTTYTAADAEQAFINNDPLVFVNTTTGKQLSYAIAIAGVDEPVSFSSFEILSQLQQRTPELALMPESAAQALRTTPHHLPWTEITARRFSELAASACPLQIGQGVGGCEAFMTPAAIAGNVAHYCAKYEGRFFECRDEASLNTRMILAGIRSAFFTGNKAA